MKLKNKIKKIKRIKIKFNTINNWHDLNLPTHDQPPKKAQHSISNTVVKAVIWPHINTLLVPKTHKHLPPVDAWGTCTS